jgi:hypothetical protein
VNGIDLIKQERGRQISIEGYRDVHDDMHVSGELVRAAEAYCHAIEWVDDQIVARTLRPSFPWPWEKKWWKPSTDNIKNLTKAGALIAAEIDRLLRLQERKSAK